MHQPNSNSAADGTLGSSMPHVCSRVADSGVRHCCLYRVLLLLTSFVLNVLNVGISHSHVLCLFPHQNQCIAASGLEV